MCLIIIIREVIFFYILNRVYNKMIKKNHLPCLFVFYNIGRFDVMTRQLMMMTM